MDKKIKAAQAALVEAKSVFDADPTEANVLAVETKAKELNEISELAARASAAVGLKARVFEGDYSEEGEERLTGSVAQKFLDSAEYKAFAASGGSAASSERSISLPSVRLGGYSEVIESKAALTTPQAFLPTERLPMIDQTIKPEITFMDLVSKGKTNADSLSYVQVTAVTRNAALQPENKGDETDTLKPISELSTDLQTVTTFGYADGYIVTTQMLADAPTFASFMDQELRTSIRAKQEHYLLNGTGTNGEPLGLLNTSGVQELEYEGGSATARNLIEKIRTGIRMVRKAGGTTTAIVLSPEDNEMIDLMTDANGNYLYGGPASVGVDTLWGRRRVVSDEVEQGTAMLGEWSQVAYLDRGGIEVQAFNQHEDFARRNLVYVRAEARGIQAFWRPARLAIITKKA